MTRRVPRLLSALPLLALLAMGAGPVAPKGRADLDLVNNPVGERLPPVSLAAEALARVPKSNGMGQVSANVGGHLLDVQSSPSTHLGKLVVFRGLGQYRVYARSNTGEISLTLMFVGHVGAWRLAAGQVEVQGVRYALAKSMATIHEVAAGKLTGTFSLVAKRTDKVVGSIEVDQGKFTVEPNS